ncbi:Mannosyl-oligosaccharide 1,2-alpha-mannosidase IC [Sphaceloma murrayae]|uniref:alpha-1,2-Mannosidase n=1 Tax=Sphaceloma murrayae TaxID=2082308 RepID=A0A2K1QLU8_9PEZI|nr:Mannosyl-oligosaccharide 1,2-alpha-mannosidase IC [Sphaceloma murrayae]
MPSPFRRNLVVALTLFTLCFLSFSLVFEPDAAAQLFRGLSKPIPKFHWKDISHQFPVDNPRPLPTTTPKSIPQVQFQFPPESSAERREREARLQAVKNTFIHSWQGYKKHAWLQDEVAPLTGRARNGFGGWGATLVDSLDTLWIMGMKRDFLQAVDALDYIDFSSCPDDRISVFETTIRYLGGLLAAYDLSDRQVSATVSRKLLDKAKDVGDMLYKAFDTPGRMPITQWYWERAAQNTIPQETPYSVLLAEYGSLSLEFTRLSQITGEVKYYDAIARIMDVFALEQNRTNIPGLWPVQLKAKSQNFASDTLFTLGSMADSTYEYLPKQYLLLNGRDDTYEKMYLSALAAANETLFFRPVTPNTTSLLFSGNAKGWSPTSLHPDSESQHLTCFAGGMVALGAKLFSRPDDLATARALTDGCIWAYESMPTGIMPEIFTLHRCDTATNPSCTWSETSWHDAIRGAEPGRPSSSSSSSSSSLSDIAQTIIQKRRLQPGFTRLTDRRYLLRPEALESVFVLYRLTGDRKLMDDGWRMFKAIEKHTRTDIAHAAIRDVTVEQPGKEDKMESFWTGETLKYAYLLFSEPGLVGLDDFVLNTEAHPLRRGT